MASAQAPERTRGPERGRPSRPSPPCAGEGGGGGAVAPSRGTAPLDQNASAGMSMTGSGPDWIRARFSAVSGRRRAM